MNILDEVKTRLSITGSDLDGTIQGMIDDVVAYCRSAGLKYTQLMSTRAVGLIARGVADLWNYGAGNGKFSDIFQLRLNQMTLDAASMEQDIESQEKSVTITENGTTTVTPDDGYVLSSVNVDVNVPSKPEQVKSVTITENGTTTVTPDDGYVLSSVNVDVNVPSKPEQVKSVTITENGTTEITPDEGYVLSGASVSVDVASDNNIKLSTIDIPVNTTNPCVLYLDTIDMSDVILTDQTRAIVYLFANLQKLKKITWGGFSERLTASDLSFDHTFYFDKAIEEIDLSPFGTKNITSVYFMFYGCISLKKITWGGLKVHASALSHAFYNCTALESLDTSFLDHDWNGIRNMINTFFNCTSLKSIDLSNLNTINLTDMDHTFSECSKLESITFENGCFSNTSVKLLDLSYSPLTHDCAVDIFNKLAPRTNSPTIKLSTTTKGYLTEEEYAVATAKGWVVS